MKTQKLHIGVNIQKELNRQNKTVAWFAEQMGLQRPNCYRIIRSESINTDRLILVSKILQHDFFKDYSKYLNL